MGKKEFSIKSSDGINVLAAYHYPITGKFLKGALVILHGMNEYAARYENFNEYLNEQGYAVVSYDQLGHGQTAKEEDLGYFGDEGGNDFLARDAKLIVDQTKIWYKDVPIILLGHSMGSNVGRYFIEKYPKAVDGFIMMGGMGAGPTFGNGINLFMLKLLTVFQGKKARNKAVSQMAFKPYLKKIADPTTSSAWLTKDDEVCRAYKNDKFCNFHFTLQGMLDVLDLKIFVNRPEWFAAVDSELPILIVSGQEDACGNYGADLQIIYDELAKKLADITLKLYPNDRHEILNETDKDQVYRDILAWLNHLCHKNVYRSSE